MPQDQASGDAGRLFGNECGRRLLELISATRGAGRSNECVWEARRAGVKCAQLKSTPNPTIGALADMLERIEVVVAAFQVEGQEFEVHWMSADDYVRHSRLKKAGEKRTKDQRMMNRSVFVRNGQKFKAVRFDPPLQSVTQGAV